MSRLTRVVALIALIAWPPITEIPSFAEVLWY
jgi:hypothetical protein